MENLKFHNVSFFEMLLATNCSKGSKDSAHEILEKMLSEPFARYNFSAEQKRSAAEVLAKEVVYVLLMNMIGVSHRDNVVYSKVLFDLRVPPNGNSDEEQGNGYTLRAIDMSNASIALNPTGCLICKSNFASSSKIRLLEDMTFLKAFIKQLDAIFGFKNQKNGKWIEWTAYLE